MKTLPVLLKSLNRAALAGLLLAQLSHSAMHAADATNSIVWNAEQKTLDMDIDNKPLSVVVADFKKATGREIVVPPGVTKTVSVKFSGKSMSEGLSRALDGLNYYTEVHGTELRIVIVDPNGAPATPQRTAVIVPRPPTPNSSSAIYRPPGTTGGPGGKGDGKSGSTADQKEMQRQVFEALAREAARSGKSGRDGGGDRSGSRGPGGSESSGRSDRPSPKR